MSASPASPGSPCSRRHRGLPLRPVRPVTPPRRSPPPSCWPWASRRSWRLERSGSPMVGTPRKRTSTGPSTSLQERRNCSESSSAVLVLGALEPELHLRSGLEVGRHPSLLRRLRRHGLKPPPHRCTLLVIEPNRLDHRPFRHSDADFQLEARRNLVDCLNEDPLIFAGRTVLDVEPAVLDPTSNQEMQPTPGNRRTDDDSMLEGDHLHSSEIM